ncbi:hypothetical protein ACTU6U_06470 [Microbacterium sp. A196]|uniref:hypothetical protein n=1 Tax=Microbacterium sp. A196 TaxID=3457320 RepID=UPI003FD2FFC5
MNLFIASSGNLDEERDAVEQAANAINANLATIHETVLVTHRYEQLVGAAGNAQQQINGRADTSDFFIGILHRWWGNPTGNGFDSGFFEEFTRALDRWKAGQRPRIALFFKDVERESLSDPGAQLAKVLQFQKEIRDNHTAFYNQFSNADELGKLVTQMLATDLAEHARVTALRSETGAVATDPPEVEAHPSAEPINDQLARVFQTFSDVLGGREVKSSLDADRLEFFSISLSKDDDDLPVHLVNRMFARRDELVLWEGERVTWLKAYLQDVGRAATDADRVMPYVTAGGGVERLRADLETYARSYLRSEDSNLRDGTARTLAALRLRPSDLWSMDSDTPEGQAAVQDLWQHFGSGTSRELALDYWLKVRKRSDRKLAKVLSQAPDKGLAELGSALCGLLARRPRIEELAGAMPSATTWPAVDELFERGAVAEMATGQLTSILERGYLPEGLRTKALSELVERDSVPESLLRKALEKRSSAVFVRTGWLATVEELLFNRAPKPHLTLMLLGLADSQLSGEAMPDIDQNQMLRAFAILARHDSRFSNLLDKLLQVGTFGTEYMEAKYSRHWGTKQLLDEAKAVLSRAPGPVTSYINGLRDVGMKESTVSFVEETFVIDALDYLASVNDSGVRRFARERLRVIAEDGKAMYQYRALESLAHVASDDDLDLLLGRGLSMTDQRPSRYLTQTAKRLSVTRLRKELRSENTDLATACLAVLIERGKMLSDSLLTRLLRSPGNELRLKALDQLLRSATAPSPSDLLTSYTKGKDFHYYNVVVEMDRRLAGVPSSELGRP